jgi:demethylmenaquinone methyltransferase / 2-methoxy-6-polyprenyl-1,4-benzoquinol methylase
VTTLGTVPELGQSLPDRDYVRVLFDWLAPNYDVALFTYSLAQDLRWKAELVRRLRPRRGERALDLACGTGLIFDRLAMRLGPGAVVGLDINLAMLGRARRAEPGRAVLRADSVKLPFRDGSFDLVTAGYLFKYVPLGRLSAEIRRVLRPGGRFGGYDFSAPIEGTIAGRLYRHYLHQVLPFLGRRIGRGDDSWESLLGFLAEVATTSGWEVRVKREFQQAGFDKVEQVPSLGGAITWVWAWSLPSGAGSG